MQIATGSERRNSKRTGNRLTRESCNGSVVEPCNALCLVHTMHTLMQAWGFHSIWEKRNVVIFAACDQSDKTGLLINPSFFMTPSSLEQMKLPLMGPKTCIQACTQAWSLYSHRSKGRNWAAFFYWGPTFEFILRGQIQFLSLHSVRANNV